MDDIIISNSEEGGVINLISALSKYDISSFIIMNSFYNLPFHDNSNTMGVSAKSGVIIIYEFFNCLEIYTYLDYLQS